jgi:hypothetical protein
LVIWISCLLAGRYLIFELCLPAAGGAFDIFIRDTNIYNSLIDSLNIVFRIHTFEFRCCFLYQLPGPRYMAFLGMRLPYAEPEDITIIQYGMGQVQFSALIQVLQQSSVEIISRRMPEADQVQRCGNRKLETV